MKARCFYQTNKAYKNYGGRGITVCSEWLSSFETFYSDMGERPKGTSLDRIDNSKGYSKENCRWATIKQQQRNQRSNRLEFYKGKLRCIAEIAEILGVHQNKLHGRLRYGWTLERAISRLSE
jgi:hypothetical protein